MPGSSASGIPEELQEHAQVTVSYSSNPNPEHNLHGLQDFFSVIYSNSDLIVQVLGVFPTAVSNGSGATEIPSSLVPETCVECKEA